MINKDNWTFTGINVSGHLAKITIGGDFDIDGQYKEIYFVSLFDEDFHDIIQLSFHTIEMAIECINKKYSSFPYVKLADEEGCSKCS